MFRFLHSSDLHLGRSLRQFSDDLAARLAEARFEVIDRLATTARDAGVSYVLLAGDIWDSETPSDRVLRQSLDRFAEHGDLRWLFLPGNHDPVGAGVLWTRLAAQAPENMQILAEEAPHQIETDVWVLAAPCQDKPAMGDPTAWMAHAETPPNAYRIGLAHGSILKFGGQPAGQIIDPNRAKLAGLDYLALGDWHGWTQFGDRTLYPGTPEPDRFRDGSGFSALVTVPGGRAAPEVTRCPTARFHWLQSSIDAGTAGDPAAALDRLMPEDAARRDVVLSLRLTGTLRPEDKARWLHCLEDFGHSLGSLDVDQGDLTSLVQADDLDLIDRRGALRAAADRLLAESADQDQTVEDRAAAALALDLLFTWSTANGDAR